MLLTSPDMPALTDDLSTLNDDMIAFIEGHGMRRFHGYVDPEQVQTVMWKSQDNPESWKDFVELAKTANAPFLTMDSWSLQREEFEELIQRLGTTDFSNDEDLEDARWLRTYIGKCGFVQLGFAHNGVVLIFEAATEWYQRYQRLQEIAEDFGGIPIDGPDQDDDI
jgi:hypothetical protein